MTHPTKTQAIKNILLALTWPDLAALYSEDFECQVNVAQMSGQRIEGEFKGKLWQGWTDGVQTWKSFRIPYNAATDPTYIDNPITFDLAKYYDGIGLTGWNWKERRSYWVAFDFDSIVNHEKSGLNSEELLTVEKKAFEIPWLTIRKSTSGNGIHIYVFLNPPVATQNHNEHAAVARSILGNMSATTGFNFSGSVDCFGGNMWVLHRKMLKSGGEGLKLIKKGYDLHDVQNNWREHVKVITGHARKIVPGFVTDTNISDSDRMFSELTGQYVKESLDTDHKRLLDNINENGGIWNWSSDHNMLTTHTAYLKKGHTELNFKGIFETVATGTQWGHDINCFCFPLRKGAWVVRRFTPGIREHATWIQDSAGWTYCYYNMDPNLSIAARSFDGVEHPSSGFVFTMAENAAKAAQALGADLGLPLWALSRRAKLKQSRDGRLIAEVGYESSDSPAQMKGWIQEKSTWKRILSVQLSGIKEIETGNFDDVLRHVVTSQNQDCGWLLKSDGNWVEEPLNHVRIALKSMNIDAKELDSIMGSNIFKKWRLVNKPFQNEYPGNREWNRDSCQLLFLPSDTEVLHFPTWTKILTHVGQNLDATLKEFPWARDNGITTGCDYLRCWIASLIKFPSEPLPYLFLYGPEASGKSIFHESIGLLISSSGYVRADQALLSQAGFNGELKNAVVCVVEEHNLDKNKTAYNRIKDWSTSPLLPIHPKGSTPYLIENTTHWVHTSNERTNCPLFSGDTRITVIFVDEIAKEHWESKKDLVTKLRKEAPDFLASVLSIELPESCDRLNVPVVTTADKQSVQRSNASSLDQFITDNCYYVLGKMVKFSEFYDRFIDYCDANEAMNWSKISVGRQLPYKFIKGRKREDSQFYIGNMSFEPKSEKESELPELILRGETLTFKNGE